MHVTLDGTRSRSPVGPITSWSWVQTAGPGIALAGADTAHPSFDAPAVDGAGARLSVELTVGDGRATAVATLHVEVREPATEAATTALGKIRRAMQEGSLDRETALKYLAFAIWNDPRLPAEFAGEPSKSASWARAVLSEEYATVSSETQAVLLPFLLPPGHPDGYSAPSASTAGLGPRAAAVVPVWRGSAEGAHVAVWYRADLANGVTIATNLANEIESTIWPRLQSLWTDAHMPLVADANVGGAFAGTHGKLNVFLEPIADYGYMQPYGESSPVATYVVLKQSLPFSGRNPAGLIESAAHEMTHSCQYSFRHTETYAQRRFLFEATATWAEDDVYPDHQTEQEYAGSYLDQMTLPVDDDGEVAFPYGAYLLFQWATRGESQDRAFVRRAFENHEAEPQVRAVDDAFPTVGGMKFGFERLWGQFVDQTWNRNPGESFWGVDALTAGAQAVLPPFELSVDPDGDAGWEIDVGVRHLAARIYRFTLTDPNVRTIHFFDGLTYKIVTQTLEDGSEYLARDFLGTPMEGQRGSATRVFLKRGDRWISLGNQSASHGNRSICQDTPAEEVQEIAIAFADSVPEQGHSLRPPGDLPLLWVTNIGCDHWEGSVTARTSPAEPNTPQETITATNVLFTRWHPGGIDGGELEFQLESADVSWTMNDTIDNCTFQGSQSWRQTPANGSGGLGFVPTIMSGPSHRIYQAHASSTVPVDYTVRCTWPDGSTTTDTYTKTVEWLTTESAVDPAWNPKVDDTGQVAAGTADDGQMTHTWSFRAAPGLVPPVP